MSDTVRRRIKQLRALAASTTFPEEAKSARAKADKLEAALGPPQQGTPFESMGPKPGWQGRADNFRPVGLTPEVMDQIMRGLQAGLDQHMMDAMLYGLAMNLNGQRIDPNDIFTTTPPPAKEGKTNG